MAEDREHITNLSEALTEAHNIVNAAKQRANQLLQEAEQIHNQAKDDGYAQGYKDAQKSVADTAIRLIREGAEVGEQLSEEAAKLALAICKTIIGEHVTVSVDAAKQLALRALREAVIGEMAVVAVHPDDEAVLRRAENELRRVAGGATITFVSDSSISRGGCIVQTDFGEVDASIDALLESVADRLGIPFKVR